MMMIEQIFSKELYALSLAHYALNRIESHAGIYRHYIVDYKLAKNEQTLFLFFYLLMSVHLQNGNTMLWLDNRTNNEQDEWGLSALGLKGFVFDLVKKVLPFVDRAIGEPYAKFGADIQALLLLPVEGDVITQFLNTVIDNITNKAHLLAVGEKSQLGELIRLIFGVVYICTVRFGGDIQTFHRYLQASPFFAQGAGERRIFVLSDYDEGFGIWFERSFLAEQTLASDIQRLLNAHQATIAKTAIDGLNNEQKQAVISALTNSFTIITGGPGTGKTFTVGCLVLQLLKDNPKFRLALVAPTGKAAQRMQESLQKAIGTQAMTLPEAMTIHRLLGMGLAGVPRFDKENPLPFDMIVVDEASMLGVELAQKLVCAVATGTRLIFLGDANQLAAVEAGAVLGDLCRVPSLTRVHCQLIKSNRFDETSAVGRLAKLIERGVPATQVVDFLSKTNQLTFVNVKHHNITDLYEQLSVPFEGFFQKVKTLRLGQLSDSDKQTTLLALFKSLNAYRILTASHQGKLGDEAINQALCQKHYAYQYPNKPMPTYLPRWYHGKVVMVIKNSYDLGLFNGDVGICLYEYTNQEGGFVVYFDGKEGGVPVAMLPEAMITTAYAMTIHKSQGSEFEMVAVCFDDGNQRLLGRELVYTGITRAKSSVAIYTTPSALACAITQESIRQTGLSFIFAKLEQENGKKD